MYYVELLCTAFDDVSAVSSTGAALTSASLVHTEPTLCFCSIQYSYYNIVGYYSTVALRYSSTCVLGCSVPREDPKYTAHTTIHRDTRSFYVPKLMALPPTDSTPQTRSLCDAHTTAICSAAKLRRMSAIPDLRASNCGDHLTETR